jgi:chromate reductase
MVTFAQDKVDKEGRFTDQKTRDFVKDLLISLAAWTRRLKKV